MVRLMLRRAKTLINQHPARLFFTVCSLFIFLLIMGVFTHMFEKDYYSQFKYPVEEDIEPYVNELKAGLPPSLKPLNSFDFEFTKKCKNKCLMHKQATLLIVVKSAMHHFEQRQAVRETWGQEQYFEGGDILRIFLLGTGNNEILQESVDNESRLYDDIVQADFYDAYYNNTLKTMSGFKWILDFCPSVSYVFFADDDMYVSIKNLLRFVRNLNIHPQPQQPITSKLPEHRERSLKQIDKNSLENFSTNLLVQDLNNNSRTKERLYAGYIFHSGPLRHWMSKWYVSLEEYPFHLWPPYATAGAYILSRQALIDLFYASLYTKFFRFDDVFVGLAALKARIVPVHSPHFYYWKKTYVYEDYHDIIACHGYADPNELRFVWSEQENGGYA